MSKNVSRDYVSTLNVKLSTLQLLRMEENNLEHFKRFERFIEQESLSDQQFSINRKYDLVIPKEYEVIDDMVKYDNFLSRWNPKEKNGTSMQRFIFSEKDFDASPCVQSGKTYEVIEYGIKSYARVPYLDCIKFFKAEGISISGLQVLITLCDLDRQKITFSDGCLAINPIVPEMLYYAGRSGNILEISRVKKFVEQNYVPSKSTLIGLKEKVN